MKKIHLLSVIGVVIVGVLFGVMFIPKNNSNPQEGISKASFLRAAEQALSDNNLLKAKELYQKAISEMDQPGEIDKTRGKLEAVNIKIIFSPLIDECSEEYVVKAKDALSKIAKNYNTTVEFIKLSNNLSSDTIRPGQKLKINICPFSIVVDKSQNLLFLKRKDEIAKTYLVATGKDNSTPVGNFKIVNKLVDPTWFRSGAVISPDSPDNILGTRWLGFDLKGYGIHGTTEPNSLGQQITLGCVRMKNEEVEEIFSIVPVGTEVIIID